MSLALVDGLARAMASPHRRGVLHMDRSKDAAGLARKLREAVRRAIPQSPPLPVDRPVNT